MQFHTLDWFPFKAWIDCATRDPLPRTSFSWSSDILQFARDERQSGAYLKRIFCLCSWPSTFDPLCWMSDGHSALWPVEKKGGPAVSSFYSLNFGENTDCWPKCAFKQVLIANITWKFYLLITPNFFSHACAMQVINVWYVDQLVERFARMP